MEPELRTPDDADDQALADLRTAAFGLARSAWDPPRGWDWVPHDRQVVACLGGRVVGQAAAWSFGQWFGGRRLERAGIAGVCVAADVRRGGVGRRVMTRLLAEQRARGAVLSALHPAVTGFYRNLGYELAGTYARDRFGLLALGVALGRSPGVAGPGAVELRPAVASDLPAVRALIADRARRGAGLLDHEERRDRQLLATDPAAWSVVAVRGGAVVGLVCFEHVAGEDPHAGFVLSVVELVGVDVDVEAELWRVLTRHHPGCRTATAPAPVTELPRSSMDPELVRVEHSVWMLRLLDVRAALTGRGWPAGVRARLVLDVDEPLVAEPAFAHNGGRLALTVADGAAVIGAADEGEAAVAMGVSTLAGIYSGYLDPADAAYRGLLRGADGGAVGLLRTLFAGPAPMVADYF